MDKAGNQELSQDVTQTAEAIGSIDFAMSHVPGLKEEPHIVILHTDREGAAAIERLLRKRLENKGFKLTIMIYDKESGEARMA